MRKKNPQLQLMCQSQKEQTVLSNFQGIVFKVMSFINLRYFKIFINISDLSRRFILFTDHAMFLFLVLLKEIYIFFPLLRMAHIQGF